MTNSIRNIKKIESKRDEKSGFLEIGKISDKNQICAEGACNLFTK